MTCQVRGSAPDFRTLRLVSGPRLRFQANGSDFGLESTEYRPADQTSTLNPRALNPHESTPPVNPQPSPSKHLHSTLKNGHLPSTIYYHNPQPVPLTIV
eukprot:1495782-Rhodomonas_salina.2